MVTAMENNASVTEKSYEQAIMELERIVERMESGGVALEETVRLYEEGIGLAEYCKTLLEGYEGRMDKAIRRGGTEE